MLLVYLRLNVYNGFFEWCDGSLKIDDWHVIKAYDYDCCRRPGLLQAKRTSLSHEAWCVFRKYVGWPRYLSLHFQRLQRHLIIQTLSFISITVFSVSRTLYRVGIGCPRGAGLIRGAEKFRISCVQRGLNLKKGHNLVTTVECAEREMIKKRGLSRWLYMDGLPWFR